MNTSSTVSALALALATAATISSGCAGLFKKSPAKAAYEQRQAAKAFPCIDEATAAESRVAEMLSTANRNDDVDWTWQCEVNGDKQWWKAAKQDGAGITVAISRGENGSTFTAKGTVDGNEIVFLEDNLVYTENGSRPAKQVYSFKMNGQTLEGTVQNSWGHNDSNLDESWVCKSFTVTCTR